MGVGNLRGRGRGGGAGAKLSKHQTSMCEECQLNFLIPGKEPFLLEGGSETIQFNTAVL